jgi:hypothetical protein
MIWSVIIYTPILLALAWVFGWLAMVLVVVAFGLGIGVGAAWEDEQREGADDTRVAAEQHAHRHGEMRSQKRQSPRRLAGCCMTASNWLAPSLLDSRGICRDLLRSDFVGELLITIAI